MKSPGTTGWYKFSCQSWPPSGAHGGLDVRSPALATLVLADGPESPGRRLSAVQGLRRCMKPNPLCRPRPLLAAGLARGRGGLWAGGRFTGAVGTASVSRGSLGGSPSPQGGAPGSTGEPACPQAGGTRASVPRLSPPARQGPGTAPSLGSPEAQHCGDRARAWMAVTAVPFECV